MELRTLQSQRYDLIICLLVLLIWTFCIPRNDSSPCVYISEDVVLLYMYMCIRVVNGTCNTTNLVSPPFLFPPFLLSPLLSGLILLVFISERIWEWDLMA